MGNREGGMTGRGWTAKRRAVNFRLSHEDKNAETLLFPTLLRARFAYRLAGGGRPVHRRAGRFQDNQQNSPEYLAINPKGRVPALVTDRGILTETPAMLAFIAQSFPLARLAPLDDAFAFAQVQSFNSYLCSTVHVAHAHGGRGYRWATDEASFADMKRKVPETMARLFFADRTQDAEGPVGDGRRLHHLRSLSVYAFGLAGR